MLGKLSLGKWGEGQAAAPATSGLAFSHPRRGWKVSPCVPRGKEVELECLPTPGPSKGCTLREEIREENISPQTWDTYELESKMKRQELPS